MDEVVSGGNSAAPSGDAGTASPAVQSQSVSGSAAPAEQGTPASGITDSTEREGFIPRPRFDEVNTRMTTAEKALADYRQQHGWAESVKREQLEEMAQWYDGYKGDPAEFLERAYQEALNHPVHGATVKSRVGKLLSSMRAQQQADPTFEPDVPVMDANGQIVTRTYSADLVKQMLAHEIQKSLQPYQQDLDSRKTQAQRAQQKQQAEAQADADIQYVKSMPMFEEHKADILAAFQANPRLTFRQAYDEVLKTKIFPSIGQKSEAKVLSDLQQKANAQTVNAGVATGSAPPKFKNFSEAYAYYDAHPEERERMANR